jgi:NAD(P)-dependent dehydrogenase (short-subunit alcohol dehydrogenase family)
MFDLSGKVAFITGAGQGMGAGVAATLAAQGAVVGVNDLHADRAAATVAAIVAAGGRAVVAAGDVRDRAAMNAAIDATEEAFGPVDILIHNAGIPADGFPLARFRELDPTHWDLWMPINYGGMLNTAKRVIDGMCERKWGRIVFVSSEAGRTGMHMGIACYGAAKAATVQFCRHLSQEVARDGVTVNCLALGRMSAAIVTSDVVRGGPPVGRLGCPDDVAAAVVYLVSDEASFVTGQTLGVNGGGVTS